MKQLLSRAPWVLTILAYALFSCNDPTVIGSDLLAGDELDIEFTDTVTLTGFTVIGDSVRTFDPDVFTTDFTNFHCGDFMDPVFGRSTATIYAQFNLNTTAANFQGALLDSIVLMLPYNAAFSYGNLDEEHTFEIYELVEGFRDSVIYYSNDGFEVKPQMIGTVTVVPKVADSVVVIVPNNDSLVTQKLPPHLRIKLDPAFSNAFFTADSVTFTSASNFLGFFKGIEIRPASQNKGLVSFNVRNSLTALRVYYNDAAGVYRQYNFPVFARNPVSAKFTHDYSGSIAADFVGPSPVIKDSLFFAQGMAGLNIDIEFPYADALTNIVVNRAELVLPIVNLPDDIMSSYDPVQQFVASEVRDNGALRVIDDVSIAVSRQGDNFGDIFGGRVTTEGNYKLNITAHYQNIQRGLASKKIRVTVYLKQEHAERVVLAGPRNGATPAKLRLSYTRF